MQCGGVAREHQLFHVTAVEIHLCQVRWWTPVSSLSNQETLQARLTYARPPRVHLRVREDASKQTIAPSLSSALITLQRFCLCRRRGQQGVDHAFSLQTTVIFKVCIQRERRCAKIPGERSASSSLRRIWPHAHSQDTGDTFRTTRFRQGHSAVLRITTPRAVMIVAWSILRRSVVAARCGAQIL